MTIDTDYVDPATLTGYVRELPAPRMWVLNQFLPDRLVEDVEAYVEQLTRHNRAAQFRAWDAETPMGQRDSFKRDRVQLPPLGEKLIVSEYERLQLERVRSRGDTTAPMVNSIYDDAEVITRHVRARMELARGDVLTDGKFTLSGENGLTLEADYGLPASHSVSPATVWSDHANATVIDDLRTWADTYTDDAGESPGAMFTTRTVIGHMLRNQEVRDLVGMSSDTTSILTQTQLNTVLQAHGLPPVGEYNAKIENSGGSTVRPVPEDHLVMLPEDPSSLGSTVWGITAESLELAAGENPSLDFEDAPGLVGVVLREADPVKIMTKVTGVGMPVLADPNKLLVADVL
jgi:hypothetical protein